MQIEKIDKSETMFKPFELKIIIEEENDLRILYHIFNTATKNVKSSVSEKYPVDNKLPFENKIWKLVDSELKRINEE